MVYNDISIDYWCQGSLVECVPFFNYSTVKPQERHKSIQNACLKKLTKSTERI